MASSCVSQRRWSRIVKMTLFLFFLIPMAAIGTGNIDTTVVQKQKLDIQRQLKRLNKPALKSIKSPDGDIIDCVHIKNQPAFDHPFFKNHTIQMRPSFHPEGLSFDDVSSKSESLITQLWHLNGRCPEGSIPIKRTKEEDLLRASSVASYGREKYPQSDTTNKGGFHEHALTVVTGDKYYGTKATINSWKPQIQEQDEFSLSKLLILGGVAPKDLNTIEAGWMVNHNLFGDYNTRLFTFFATNKNANQIMGCYNLLCSPGFVQINKEIALGGSLNPLSVYAGSQYELNFLVWKDIKGRGDWWMQVGNKYLMGYWPASLFVSLSESASQIQWGGEVINQQKNGQHTSTQMGSGHFPEEGFSRASYFKNLQIVDGSSILRYPKKSFIVAEKPNCYNVTNFVNYFYYGGPGRNPNCP
ncbi:hypothetical protein CMV_021439 [Castanea mollissima]|uniref:Neprosin PEP catalytic domain-containing protein n=1 Tax=Castanea mollissima TaxID=60419 RepID=A0A8J4QU79_9ROSI|nr:hypothetical protein CMV_021439 [Castanea mollissima]